MLTDTTTFQAPGPGGWMRLADHFPAALTREYRRLYAETCPPGMAAYMARYGVLAKTVDVAFVRGHLYIAPVPLAGPREIKRTPPTAAVWLLSRVHPAFRSRTCAARHALRARPWRAAAMSWFVTERDQWVQRNQAVQDLDPAAMNSDDLATHLHGCRQLVVDGYRRHFELHGDDLLPVGLLLARAAEWGIDPSIAMQSLDGASPASAGTCTPPDWQLVTGYDLDSLAWCELPERPAPQPAPAVTPMDLRPLVPEQERAELAQLVDDARTAVALRDDNGVFTGSWPMGLLRRTMSEVGRRCQFADPALALEATVDELDAALAGRGAPSSDELKERSAERQANSRLDAPHRLGPEFAIPPLDALPRPLALMGAAQLATADHMAVGSHAVGVGTTSYTGRALVVDDPATAFALIEPGDVVVTSFTSPSWNHLLTLAGAVVTTTGGLVSHAAVLARELGIPAVLGDATAMRRLGTGMTVEVDPREALVSTTAPSATGHPLSRRPITDTE
jgi:rifampicin phosphotransferase